MDRLPVFLVIAAFSIPLGPETASSQETVTVCHCERCQRLRQNPHYGGPGQNVFAPYSGYGGPAAGAFAPLAPRTFGLPPGRPYYGNRYFGNYNNRWFGPQYGHF